MLLLASSVCGLFKWRLFEPEVILLGVGWYLRFHFRIAKWRSCSPSGVCTPITSRCGMIGIVAPPEAAIGELGYTGAQGEHMIVVANGPKVHNLIVCTLCSCYPWAVLGLPPVWYKAAPYRSRAVIDPRGLLREFGLELPEDVEIRVWDSTAAVRYLVLPERPAGSETLSEEELTALVTRDAMVGIGRLSSSGTVMERVP